MLARADKVSIVFPLSSAWALVCRPPSLAALAVWVVVAGFAPCVAQAQEGDAAARVTKLEAEIANLKLMVGTLESLVRTTPPPAQMRGAQAPEKQDDLGPRVRALETQIGALTHQIEQIGQQMDALQTKLDATMPAPKPAVAAVPQAKPSKAKPSQAKAPPTHAKTPEPVAPPQIKTQAKAPPAQGQTPKRITPPAPVVPKATAPADISKPHWYGPRPGTAAVNTPQKIVPPATGGLPDDMPRSLAALPNADAQALYEKGYGALLQRDYRAAEASFSKMVAGYPNDPLAGSAQYWVGETQYIRKQYQKAADSFLAGYRKYSSSDKAPDTLLKLGMALAALGEKDAACSTFKQLNEKFPNAPDHLRKEAKGAAGKAGCKR